MVATRCPAQASVCPPVATQCAQAAIPTRCVVPQAVIICPITPVQPAPRDLNGDDQPESRPSSESRDGLVRVPYVELSPALTLATGV